MCTYMPDRLRFVLQANLCLPWITEISKSPLLFTQVSFQSPQLAKTKYFVLLGLSAFVLSGFNTNPNSFIYAIYTVSSAATQWHKLLLSTFPQVHAPKTSNVTCVKRNRLCWLSPCVPVQNCIYILCRVFVQGNSSMCLH